MLCDFLNDLNSVYRRDPAARNHFDLITLYPGVQALFVHRISHRLWGWGLKWLARLVANLGRWITGIEIHPAARIGRRFFIDHGMGVVIGETAEIGDDCTLYHGVTLGGTSWEKGKRHPTLEDDVVIGAGAKILGPIHIGRGARIGSNAVVVREVPAGSTVVGVPGRVVQSQAERDARQQRRDRMAERIGFDAYGATRDMPDPIAHAINCMLDHMHGTDERVAQLCERIRELGGEVDEVELTPLEGCKIRDATAEGTDDGTSDRT